MPKIYKNKWQGAKLVFASKLMQKLLVPYFISLSFLHEQVNMQAMWALFFYASLFTMWMCENVKK